MEITPKAMEIEYIRIKRFNQEIEKVYATPVRIFLRFVAPISVLCLAPL